MNILSNIDKGLHLGSAPKLKYRADIDGLRAVAVLAVVLYHADFRLFSGGYVGVDLFFVLSGFLITKIILADLHKGTFSLKVFYERRIKRLFPALFAHFAAIVCASYFLLLPSDFAFLGENLIAATLFLANVFFWKESGYFAPDSHELPLLHTWSLAVEEQFYIFWPLVLWVCTRFLSTRLTQIFLSLIFALSLFIAMMWIPEKQHYAFYLIPARSFELMVGAWLAFPFAPNISSKRTANLCSMLGILMILIPIFTYDHHTLFPGWTALPICMGTGLLIIAGEKQETHIQKILKYPLFIFIGLLSYSLYLWHWPIFALARYILSRPLETGEALCAVACSIVISYGSWKYIEGPFRHSRSPYILHVGFLCLVFSCGLGWAMYTAKGFPERVQESVLQADQATQHKPSLQKHCHNPSWKQDIPNPNCKGGKGSVTSVLLWGDSHGNHFSPALELLGTQQNFQFTQITRNACIPLLGVLRTDGGKKQQEECQEFTNKTLAYIQNHPEIETIVLASRWTLHAEGTMWGNEQGKEPIWEIEGETRTENNNHVAFSIGMERLLLWLEKENRRVILLGQVPEFGFYSGKCLAKGRLYEGNDFSTEHCTIFRSSVEKRQSFIHNELLRFAQKYPHALYVPLIDTMCVTEYCIPQKEDVVLYKDDDHLSVAGAQWLANQAVFSKLVWVQQ